MKNYRTLYDPDLIVSLQFRIEKGFETRCRDIATRRGYLTVSEFIRYAVRKELDYQTDLIYSPKPKVELD